MSAKVLQLEDWIPEDDFVVVPEGEYELSYISHKTWNYMGRSLKVSILYRIHDFGSHYGKPVYAHYNVRRFIGKPGKNGRFAVGWRSDFMFDFATCFGRPARKDRIPMSKLEKNLVRGRIRTVTRNSRQIEYPESLRYSVVDRLLGVKEI